MQLLEILKKMFLGISMDAIYNWNRLDSQSDCSFLRTNISLLELEINIRIDW